jgi:hypothetical protein
VLFLVCSKLVLTGQVLTAELRPPFASLAAFPLAGSPPGGQSEPNRWRRIAKKPGIMESWLGTLDAIRTFWLHGAQNVMPWSGTVDRFLSAWPRGIPHAQE